MSERTDASTSVPASSGRLMWRSISLSRSTNSGFALTPAFAHDVLAGVGPATRELRIPEARFAATKPFYENALVPPLFEGGNMGVRRRQLHALMQAPDCDPLAAAG